MASKRAIQLLTILSIAGLCLAQTDEPEQEEHHCIWYGQCTYQNSHYQNCPYNGTAKLLEDEEAQKILLELCPNVYKGADTPVCCDGDQVRSMALQLNQAAGLFKRCSTCLRNFMLGICSMSCSSDHSRFLTPTYDVLDDVEYVKEIEFRIDDDFVHDVYDSCKNVLMSSTGLPVMDFTCPPYNAKTCTPARWYRYLGDPEMNEFVPFKISYNYTIDDDEYSFKGEAKSCSESYPGMYRCSCMDCPDSCPSVGAGELEEEEEGFMVHEWNGIAFVVACVVGFIGVVVILITTVIFRGRKMPKLNSGFLQGFPQVHDVLSSIFAWWGTICARNAILVLAIASWIIGGLCYGIMYMEITTDPVELWASETSQSRVEKDYFDRHFGPFYRTNQIFIKPLSSDLVYHETADGTITFGPAYEKGFLKEVFELQESIMKIGRDEGAGLETVCYAPVVEFGHAVTIDKCLIQSIYGYFNHDMNRFMAESEVNGYTVNYLNKLDACLTAPMSIDCQAPYGGPLENAIAVGGFSKFESNSSDYHMATAVVLTFLTKNYVEEEKLGPTMAWEKRFIDFLQSYENDKLDIAFSAERSIEDNIQDLSDSETSTVIISYLVMFIYIAIALGKVRSFRNFFRESKIMLAIGGIVIVLLSVVCSLGFWGYFEMKTTMLAIEVLPFLILAVGVDNIFMLVHAFNRVDRVQHPDMYEALGQAVGHVGPSILLTASSEFFCFLIGGLSEMPAVKTFAFYAAIAILINFLLQITTFVALMSLDQKRYESGRWDLIWCMRDKDSFKKSSDVGLLEKFFDKFLAEHILSKRSRVITLILSFVLLCVSSVPIATLPLGLDQELSMPKDSHIVKYFNYMSELLEMGPPIYWVVKPGINYTLRSGQNVICGGQECYDDSAAMILYTKSKYPDITYLARPAASWLDDYVDWLGIGECCKMNKTDGSFCQSSSSHSDCISCPREWKPDGLRPTAETFSKYIPFFLLDLPGPMCAKAGRASYGDGVNYVLDDQSYATVGDTYLMQFSRKAVTSKEFYTALRQARKAADEINLTFRKHGVDASVFPYCVYFVFYEQYLTIWEDALYLLGLSLAAIFVVTLLLTGLDIISSLIVLLMVVMILIHMFALMWAWGVTLNAVSLVNLVVCVGIAVEFISHIVRTFKISQGTSMERAHQALTKTGSSVLTGITLTKFAGIVVLAFAKSSIFQIFYFRMYLLIVLLGASHGLLVLPVILYYFGPRSVAPKKEEKTVDNGSMSTSL